MRMCLTKVYLVDLNVHVVQMTNWVLYQFLLGTILSKSDSQKT
jgi:hypothetical protein